MCGIIGILSENSKKYEDQARAMMNSLAHRGPDSDGVTNTFNNCLLGHKRLSIVDLSTGHQPMFDESGKVAIVFNGEIYGYQDIRKKISDYKFRTNSDTEVIIALFKKYSGSFLEHLPGMFAFALWDENKKTLTAARDRFGEKPFYYAIGKNGEFIFASEIKAILASGLINPEISTDAIAHYLHKLYVHPNTTIYKNIFTLPPAHMLVHQNGKFTVTRYWNLPTINESISLEEALPEFRRLLEDAVRKQLIADVSVGAFLSGGLDSTTVVAIASKLSPHLKTFAFGYEGTKNELPFARMAAEKYKTEHFELHDTEYDIADLLLKMADVYDEPLADSSTISTYLISKLTREHTKVVLSGDGGDELLGGYFGWYKSILYMNDGQKVDFPGKVLFMRMVAQIALRTKYKHKAELISKIRGLHYKKTYKNTFDAHQASNVFFKEHEIQQLGLQGKIAETLPSWNLLHTVDDAMRNDIEDYMPGDILTKIDRASMANSLELRAPFLDVPFAEFALSLPHRLKINTSEGKLILRKAFETEWPEPIQTRSKAGFGAPVHIWLQKPKVQKLIDEYLNDPHKKIFNYISFSETKVYKKTGNYSDYKIWILLTLSIWMEKHTFK